MPSKKTRFSTKVTAKYYYTPTSPFSRMKDYARFWWPDMPDDLSEEAVEETSPVEGISLVEGISPVEDMSPSEDMSPVEEDQSTDGQLDDCAGPCTSSGPDKEEGNISQPSRFVIIHHKRDRIEEAITDEQGQENKTVRTKRYNLRSTESTALKCKSWQTSRKESVESSNDYSPALAHDANWRLRASNQR